MKAAVLIVWFASVLLGIAFWGTVIYAAIHFLAKLW